MLVKNILRASLGLVTLTTVAAFTPTDVHSKPARSTGDTERHYPPVSHPKAELRKWRHDGQQHNSRDVTELSSAHWDLSTRDDQDDYATVFVDAEGNEYAEDSRFSNVKLNHPNARVLINKRDQQKWYGVYECDRPNFHGKCQWRQVIPTGKKNGPCYARIFLDNPNVSLGIDKGIICTLYEELGCKGHSGVEKIGYVMNSKTTNFREDFHNPLSFRCSVITFGDPYTLCSAECDDGAIY